MEKRVRSESEPSEDDNEEDVTPVKPAEDGRWYCLTNCDKSCKKKQDLRFHIMGGAMITVHVSMKTITKVAQRCTFLVEPDGIRTHGNATIATITTVLPKVMLTAGR